jgi:diguanylate cyclase (GGDEF)-like protein
MTSYPATFEVPTTDALTGLIGSAYFRHLLRDEILPEAGRNGEPLSLCLMDIDSFLKINSEQDRGVADSVLKDTARLMRKTLPETALLVRHGGDEFAMVLPGTRLDDAFTLCEELRRRFAARPFGGELALHLTCSIGLAAFPANGNGDVELLRAADQALFVAKMTGRNKVALPLDDARMITKTSHYTATQLERLAQLAKTVRRNEASLLREALDDLLRKHKDRLEALNRPS